MIECLTCNICTAIYTPSVILSLNIPMDSSSLMECLESYFAEEKLPASWSCSSHFCSSSQIYEKGAHKKLVFSRLPSIIILNLKRFSFNEGDIISRNF